jgi:hypothetical protein
MKRARLIGLIVVLALAGVAAGWALAGGDGDALACPPITDNPDWTVARRWDEVILDAIRRDLPAPTVHSRNLFHVSAAMWDAWAAYDPDVTGYFVTEKHQAADVESARDEAISYAAYRVAEHRYINAIGASDTIPEFDALMESLCYPIDVTTTEGDSPAAVGNRIAAAIIEFGTTDGALEEEKYQDETYAPVNDALIVNEPGAGSLTDPNRWQPLQIENMISQNGIPVVDGTQQFIGPHWGYVAGFVVADDPDGLPIDPGSPPYLHDAETDAEYKRSAVEVISLSAKLDPTSGVMIDISPGSIGNNSLGTNDGRGYAVNPVTGEPYEENIVNEADYGRSVAEFWADGPSSETPPGHWNTLANTVSDGVGELRVGGTGDLVDRLEWDVKLYFVLNGAMHDAAVSAWGAKGYYDYVRPISMIRYMGGLGQSSDPELPAYDPDGLPLADGLVEIITPETTATGERHDHLAGYEGEIAILAWGGNPDDPETELGGVDWIRAVEWVPYQLPTFVTPSFAGYVSGHSSFSRAGAEVMAAFTGDEYFPGGLGEWTIPAGSFDFEAGPDTDIVLQWGTYFDAADQAGRSRLYGGIHVAADDLNGRLMGAAVGRACWQHAQEYFSGTLDG